MPNRRISLLRLPNQTNTNDLVHINRRYVEDEHTCGTHNYKDIYALITTPIVHNVYVYYHDSCIPWSEYEDAGCNSLFAYRELTIDEARSFFVCTE